MNKPSMDKEDRRIDRVLAAAAVFDQCGNAPYVEMLPCWYPDGHTTPHSWESLRPGESWKTRDAQAVGDS